jgi:hypothetical protein
MAVRRRARIHCWSRSADAIDRTQSSRRNPLPRQWIVSPAPLPRTVQRRLYQETAMNDEILNQSIRKFLKMVGVSSQREIEQAVAKAVSAGSAAGTLAATMTLEIPKLGLKVKFDGDIQLG